MTSIRVGSKPKLHLTRFERERERESPNFDAVIKGKEMIVHSLGKNIIFVDHFCSRGDDLLYLVALSFYSHDLS